MSIYSFKDIFNILGKEKSLQWIETNSGSIDDYGDYNRAAESSEVLFSGWFGPTPAKIQLKETGTVTHKRFTLRFDPSQNLDLNDMKVKDIIVYDGKRYMIDFIYPFDVETNTRHFSCLEADT